jgi:hypothetical protein
MIYDRATMALVHCFLLGSVLEKLNLLSWWCLDYFYKELITVVGLFFYVVLFLCASVMPLRHCVVAEAKCNWYFRDIIVHFLSKQLI